MIKSFQLMTSPVLFCVAFSLLLTACHSQKPAQQVDLLLTDIQVIDVKTGEIVRDQLLAIKDQRITAIDDTTNASSYHSSQTIQGSGAYVMPALHDMHVHINHENVMPLFTRYGVGLVFNLSGGPKHLNMRKQLDEGRLIGPKLLTVGPTLDGQDRTNPLFVSVSPNNAADVVAGIKAAGYDGIKVYQQMDQATLEAVVQAAARHHMFLVGHVSRMAGINGSLAAGLSMIAHGEELTFEAFDEDHKSYDLTQTDPIVSLLQEHGASFMPNLNYVENIPEQALDLSSYLQRPEMQSITADLYQSWDVNQSWYANRDEPEQFGQQIKSMSQFVAQLVATANSQKIKMVLGSDSGFGGAVPGYSAHLELQSLVQAGLSPLEAIQVATLNPGQYLLDQQLIDVPRGQISVGFAADLLLLENNPLADIQATTTITGVLLQGRYHSHSDLDEMEQQLQTRLKQNLPKAKAFEQHILNADINAAQALVKDHLLNGNGEPLIDASSCIFMGYRYYYGKRRALAGQFYQLCAEMLPDEPRLLYYMGKSKAAEGLDDEANMFLNAAKQADPWFD